MQYVKQTTNLYVNNTVRFLQEFGHYVHNPPSGIEKEAVSMKDFYKADELKYHGHGSQRGALTLNFFGNYKENCKNY